MTYVHAMDALGDPTRRRIFEQLRNGPKAVGELAEGVPVSRPAVSQHLRVLKDAGLVADRKVGTRRLYEITESGEKAHWAQVLAWEPPRCLVLAWHVNPETPAPTEIEVHFVEDGADTRVELEHRGWERLGEELGRAGREGYDGGWGTGLGYYEQRRGGGERGENQ